MVATNWPGLVGGVTPDPWVERDKLTSGDPDAITGLATTFESAAQEAESATRTGGQASLATGEAYRVDGDEVHAVDVHTGQTRDLLGAGGADLERIGQILRGIGSDLSAKSGTATQKVTALEGELQTLQNTFNQTEQTYLTQRANALTAMDAMTLDVQFQAARATFQANSVDRAETAGRSVADLVTQYDDALGGRSRELSELGYTVPAGIDQGPGDVESDPNAGAQDARTVADAMQQDPGQQSMAEIDAASGQMRAINDKVERGEPLTTAERDYLNQFYETLGTDNLARLPEYLQDAAAVTTPPSTPSFIAEGTADSAMQPFGDSIMNLSQGARYESLPAPVRELLDTRVGHVDPHTGLRYPNERYLNTSGYPSGSNPTDYVLGGGVTGLNRYQGITDLLSSSERAPGDALAGQLVDSAIRTRQDLNAAQEGGRWVQSMAGGSGPSSADSTSRLDTLVDDSAASDALSLAARNVDASSTALLDDRQRPAVLGLNWEDATGATDLIAAGTLRDEGAGGGTQRQADAALAVVQEVGSDIDGYVGRSSDAEDAEDPNRAINLDGRMVEPVREAVVDVGVGYIDAFAASPGDQSETIDNRTDAMGRNVGDTFQLTSQDRDRYLQFVSGTGDDPAARFHSEAKTYSRLELIDALQHGDQSNVQMAMERAGRLDGAITQANFDYTLDTTAAEDAQQAAVDRAATIDGRANQGALNTLAVVGREGLGYLPGGKVASTSLSILAEIAKGGVGMATLPDAPSSGQLAQNIEDLRSDDGPTAVLNRDMLLADAMNQAGLFGDDPPAILTADEDPKDGEVDAPTSDSQRQDELGGAIQLGLDRWAREHGAPGTQDAPDLSRYTEARSTAFTAGYDGSGSSADSAWSDAVGPMYYGDSEQRYLTGDPRDLDDPEYNVRMGR
jgi:hypothetical protein